MKNQECKTSPQVINVNSNNPILYPFSIKISKCRGNCNILMIHMQKFVYFFRLNKLFNLMSRTSETRFIEWHEKC